MTHDATGRPKKRGRPAEVLVIEGNWQSAVKQALKKGKPPAPKKASKKKRKSRA